MTGKTGLSVCMIARDEAERLPRALASVRRVAAEIVVVDTGSMDGTIAVARSFGARVIEAPWQEDFAAARNIALGAARSGWILSLDADEELAPGQDSALRACLADREADAWDVVLRSRLSGAQSGMEFVHRFPRLFRNGLGIRFTGRVHEQVGPSLQGARARLRESSIVLLHSGYDIDTVRRKAKLERNLRLLQLDYADRPGDGFLCFHLGETWTQLGQPAEAACWYERAIAGGGLDAPHRAAAYQNLASVLLQQGCPREAAVAAMRALRIDRSALPAWLHLAGARLRMGQPEQGVRCAEAYLRRTSRVSSKGRSLGFTADAARAWLIAGEARLRQGQIGAAGEAVERIRAVRTDWAPAERLAARVALASGRNAEAAECLQRAAQLEPENAAGWCTWANVLAGCGDSAGALAVLAAAAAHVQDAGVLRLRAALQLRAQDWAGAAQSYELIVGLEPDAPDAHRRLAGLYRKLGDDGRAREHLDRLQRIEPGPARAAAAG